MKRLILLVLLSLMFFGCTKVKIDGKKFRRDSFTYFETVTSDLDGAIYKDKYTGVLYHYVLEVGLTPIMEADGTCLTWDEWVSRATEEK